MKSIKAVLYLDSFKDKKFGDFNLAVSDKGLRIISFGKYSGLSDIFEHVCNRNLQPEKNQQKTKEIKTQLQEYFRGNRKSFDIKLDLDYFPSFKRKVLRECSKIPYGKVMSYGQLAKKAGSPKAARAVGQIMASNPIAIVVPCHRVVGSDGSLTGFAAGMGMKKKLLMLEGVEIRGKRVVRK
ncbi:MAG: MGMT family protein [candidate division Zixibacteria bacterium]|nr:MGMT family protein [candidate division Zixibacteria bacterium]